MISEALFPILILFMGLLILSLIIYFINKTVTNRAKIKALVDAKNKAEEYIEKNATELSPILANFYGEKSEHYLKNIKKQNQIFLNQLILLMMEYKSNIVTRLTNALEILDQAYVNAFYEASQNHCSTTNQPSQPAPSLHSGSIEQGIQDIVLAMAPLCNQEVDEKTFNDPDAITKIISEGKEKIETLLLENKTRAEESTQYLDLIEQIRIEKKEMRQTINQALEILEQIHQKYKNKLMLAEDINVKQFNYDELLSVFKLNESKEK